MRNITIQAIEDGKSIDLTRDEFKQWLTGEDIPVKPDTDTKPPVVVAPSLSALLGEQIGTRGNDPIHLAADGNPCLYQVAGGHPLPRGFNVDYAVLPGKSKPQGFSSTNYGNDVPSGYKLPTGFGWAQFGDKAYYIVAELTNNPGPVWLRDTTSNNNTGKTTPWEKDNDN